MEEIKQNQQIDKEKYKKEMKKFLILFPVVVAVCVLIALFIVFVVFPSKEPTITNLTLHEKGTILNWEITTNSISKTNKGDGTYDYYVNISAKNVGETPTEFLGFSMNLSIDLIYNDGEKDYTYNLYFGWENELFTSIQPLMTKTDNLTFNVPSSIANETFKLKISENKQNPKEIVMWTLC